jgi:hypothetical protein
MVDILFDGDDDALSVPEIHTVDRDRLRRRHRASGWSGARATDTNLLASKHRRDDV